MHRPGALGAELSARAVDHRRRRSHRRRRHPSRLRLPVGKRRLRRTRGVVRLHLHRPASRQYPPDGRQGRRQAGDDRGQGAVRARLRRRPAGRSRRGHPDRRAHRLPGHHQGGRRRRRARHARGAYRGRAAERGDHDQDRSGGRLRQPHGLHGKIPADAAPYRNPDPRRRTRQRRASGRTRLLDAAPPPEGAGRGPCARARPQAQRTRSANAAPRPAARSATAAPAPSNSCTKTASSTSSK